MSNSGGAEKVLRYDTIAVSSESTVVSEYVPDAKKQVEYQSEAQLEAEFIKLLQSQAYEFLAVTDSEGLVANLRVQLELLNGITFSDSEWSTFFTEKIANETAGIVDKAAIIQEDHVQLLRREDGSVKNIYLIDKQNIHNNRLQVLNQYEVEGKRANRYDVTVLVNGLPLVHIELKRRGVELREAFNQINRYQRESFWADSGLFEYVQLFVISNGTYTKYYSNTTRNQHLKEAVAQAAAKRTSNSYEFTSWWADASNKPITDLVSFTKTFFAKHTLLNILTKYCVFTSDRMLLVMRPYQIVATERILQRIVTSGNSKTLGTLEAGGYIWHTTGSGKTLTSFKTAQLASRMAEVDKVLFVVDRKDLDYQTMHEYDRFEKGAANSNTSTRILQQQIEDPNKRIIVTTIQKLSNFVARNKQHEAYSGRFVLIFDECHRSQFGDMHTEIKRNFKNYNLFGFTGTPIFADNASTGGNPTLKTTEQAFGKKLHTYTIVDAITDKNVLPFRIDYVNTVKLPKTVTDKKVRAIDTEKALLAPERIAKVVEYMREHFDQKTQRNQTYALKERRVAGFNSLFATASIDAAKRYYLEFARQQESLPAAQKLKVGIIFSFAANEDVEGEGILPEEQFETDGLDQSSRDFLEQAITDFNTTFGQNWDTSSDGFQGYYKDLSRRLKNREIDLVIVVNMFLTGFDATTLNTLWVDKNLRQHGLIQAYSRTNRILNSVKTYGNIVSFRDLEEATNEAIALFGNKDAAGVVLLRPYREYMDEYSKLLAELSLEFEPGQLVVGEQDQKRFAELWGAILRLRNILVAFDEFSSDDSLTPFVIQNYQSTYLEIYATLKRDTDADKESILDDVEFEIELVKQIEINVDYILMRVKKYQESRGDGEGDKEIRADVMRAVDSSYTLRSKRDLIEAFINSLNLESDVDNNWRDFIQAQREKELEALILEENLNATETRTFVDRSFRDGVVKSSGTAITKILPPVSRFSPGAQHGLKKQTVIEKLEAFFERYFGLGS
ncbi:MAG: type I restriction endonuclease subunit R [Aurantimicrobium sp.]|uniref:type I restriction endonuclease subunit R n=1 Tax=Aurantimicrobium sp. TaxID=1930784 RepID=UPI002FCBC037